MLTIMEAVTELVEESRCHIMRKKRRFGLIRLIQAVSILPLNGDEGAYTHFGQVGYNSSNRILARAVRQQASADQWPMRSMCELKPTWK